ncbi:MAG: S9 family peptidase, partial [Gemmatimonadetes bacterium]|nr:S9 family peptidase [Gemmatimonadota bacterium]NIR77628.1 S9 family peptidase [Gemmatimonadota bacterium]NIT90194.1 S9 family peptidase [Gemmatimonadota bacterium]NIU29993.1 S9 family peptidase [Gemmatimonadota bacterium]NIU38186.1 S9 family peptidase [Gemmatimonadota bacterium]
VLLTGNALRAQETAGFTIADVLSAPMPSELVTAPSGARFAWVQNAGGARNLWVAVGPGFEGRPITHYAEDDGQELGDPAFTPDGSAVVYVRGGAPNREGEIPNPTSDPHGAEREIWIAEIDGTGPRTLAEGSSPAVSPEGGRIAFLRGGQIWTVGLEADAEPIQLAEIRGRATDLRWSPDGGRLAFTSDRDDHAFVGVVDSGGENLRYLDPAVDRDGEPAWSPDGRRVAFLRIPNERDRLPFGPRREGLPWSIRVVDAETGEAREVWRAPEGPGSAYQGIGADAQLLWAAGDRIVFPWERDGWLHLYSVPAGGGEATLLTPGGFEVQFVAPGPEGRYVLYDSNQDDIDRKHLWRVPADGSQPPEALTSGTGIEWAPAPAARGGPVAFLASAGTTPAHAEVLVPAGQRRWLVPSSLPDRFPSEHLVEPRQVVFPAADGMRIHGQLFLPADARPADGRPGVLFFHGGSRRQMLLGFHHRGYYHNAYALNQYLASRGYVVLSV